MDWRGHARSYKEDVLHRTPLCLAVRPFLISQPGKRESKVKSAFTMVEVVGLGWVLVGRRLVEVGR